MILTPTVIKQAYKRIQNYVYRTPLEPLPHLLAASAGSTRDLEFHRAQFLAKFECDQITGTFKARGAVSAVSSIVGASVAKAEQTIVAASTGNHALAVCYACHVLKSTSRITKKPILFLPQTAAPAKIKNLEKYAFGGVDLRIAGQQSEETERMAREFAKQTNAVYISPYADLSVIAGQGTIALEIEEQLGSLNSVDWIIIPIGGGGLAAGIAAYAKQVNPDIKILGVQPAKNNCMHASFKLGRIATDGEWNDETDTLSDATAGGIEEGSPTFELCREYVDEIVLITEEEMEDAIIYGVEVLRRMIEGAAAMTIAAARKFADTKFKNQRAVLILCGRNIDLRAKLPHYFAAKK
jgi:threonine dehydratase